MRQVKTFRLLIIFQVILVAAVIVGIVYEIRDGRDRSLDDIHQEAQRTRSALVAHSRQTFTVIDQALQRIAENAGYIIKEGPAIFNHYLLIRRSDLAFTEALSIADAQGNVLATTQPYTGNIAHSNLFKDHRDNTSHIMRVSRPRQTNDVTLRRQWVIDLSRRMEDGHGRFKGVVVATVSMEDLAEFYDSLRTGEQDVIGLMRSDGVLLTRSPFDPALVGRQPLKSSETDHRFLEEIQGTIQRRSPFDGIERALAYGQIRHYPLTIYTGISVKRHMVGWERRALVEGLMAIVLLALIGLLTLLLYRVFAQNLANQTARMRAQEENARIFNSISDAVYRVDRAWRFTYVNAQGEKLFERSREQMEGRDMWSLFPALRNTLTPNEFERALNSGQATDFECHYPPTESWFHVKAYPDNHGLTVYLQDITARKQQELKVREQEHMDSLGKLTGGVAHDFNNLLTVIMGNTELLAEAVKHDPRLHSLTNVTLEATEKGAKLVSQLLAYARRQPLNPDKVDVNQLVTQMKGLLETAVGGTVAIDYELDATLHRALIDAGRLQDALINLCVNARDAMPQGGIIQIRTRNATLTPDTLPNAQPGQYVAVEVEDGGTGMDAQTLERVFEPFFTTKEVGRGSGLGLAMVHGFISQSKGFIDIDSELGRGTRVTLYMPVA